MNPFSVHAYIPGAFFMEGKQSPAGRECHEKIAVICPAQNNRIVAARYPGQHPGNVLEIPYAEQTFLKSALTAHNRVALLCDSSLLIVCGEFLEVTGLLPVLIPDGNAGELAHMLPLLGRNDIVLSPALKSVARHPADPVKIYSMLTEQFALCDRIMRPEANTDFRLLCAMTAQLAGCRADVTSLPVGSLPLTSAEELRYSAFLLCTFLAIRGESASGPAIRFGENTHEEIRLQLEHLPESKEHTALTGESFHFLSLPCFSQLRMSGGTAGWVLEFPLPRRSSGLGALHVPGLCLYLRMTLVSGNN